MNRRSWFARALGAFVTAVVGPKLLPAPLRLSLAERFPGHFKRYVIPATGWFETPEAIASLKRQVEIERQAAS